MAEIRRKYPMRREPKKRLPSESWLPPGWVVEGKVRPSGTLAGWMDKYYIEPTSGHKFRSKKEVRNFLETGIVPVPQKKKAKVNAGVVKDKLKKSLTTTKSKTFKFDFVNVPEKIKWVCFTEPDMHYWNPFTGNEMVDVSIAREWVAAAIDLLGGSAGDCPIL